VNPTQIRRLLVFAVCALGVGALYVPGLSKPPQPLSSAPSPERPGPGSAGSVSPAVAVRSGATDSPGGIRPLPADATRPVIRVLDSLPRTELDRAGQRFRPRRAAAGATATDPNDTSDKTRPDPVSDLEVVDVTRDTVTLSWRPARDNVGVVGYGVWLNGFRVATTSKVRAKVDLFNDDLAEHVVQVRALDAAGNEGDASASMLVARPSTEPTTPDTVAPVTTSPSTTAPATTEPTTAAPTTAAPTRTAAATAGPTAPAERLEPTANKPKVIEPSSYPASVRPTSEASEPPHPSARPKDN
jgi:hypothetical protein